MIITGSVTKQGQMSGVRIQDGEATYYVQLNILTTKIMFDGLIESGYAYTSYPHGFTKDGKSIQDLEQIPFESLTEEERRDYDIPPDGSPPMSDEELRSYLPDANRHITLQPKAEALIQTREEFIAFLLSPPGTTQISDNPQSFIPLNYFVSDEALFTHKEYFQKRNEKYRELIERREKLSFECYRPLVDWMMEVGALSPDFNALDFKKAYYSWGVPGIRTQLLGMTEKEEDAWLLHSTIEKCNRFSTTVHYFGRNGKMNPPLEKGQVLHGHLNNWIDERIKTLEPGELGLVTTRSSVKNRVVSMDCVGFTVDFDEKNRRIMEKDPASEYVGAILPIRAVNGSELDTKYYNTIRAETREAYWKSLFFTACVEHLIKITTVETDKSSFKAVQEGLSISPAAAIRYIIACLAMRENHQVGLDYCGPIDGSDAETSELLNAYQAAYQFLPNMLSAPHDEFDISIFSETFGADPFHSADIIDNIILGDQNIDDIERGYIADRSISQTAIRHMIEFAEAKMGYSIDEIVDAVTGFDPHADACLSFEKEGIGKLKIAIPVRNYQESAYAGEVMNYKALSASNALTWNYVLTAMSEPGRNEGRHCAARILSWKHKDGTDSRSLSQPKIENTLKELVLSSIEGLAVEKEREAAIRCADIIVANMLFEARLKSKTNFTMPPFLGGKTVTIPDGIFYDIQQSKNFEEKVESTFGLSDCAVNSSDILFYFVNARITPHHIIPNKGMKIPEMPFFALWWDLTDKPAHLERYKSYLPEPEFNGYGSIYYAISAALPAKSDPYDEPSQTSPYSLKVYDSSLNEYHAKAMQTKDHHILTPPSLAEKAQPYFYEKRPDVPCEIKDFHSKWILSLPRVLTDEAKAKDGVKANLLEEVRPCVSWVRGFALDDYLSLPQEAAYDIFSACGDRIKAVQYLGDSVRFLDGYTHNFRLNELDIDDARYAVFKTSGGIYIPFLSGKIAKTDIPAYGG